jgi:serine/threonine protein phosphatase PrpC
VTDITTAALPALQAAFRTDPGRVRTNNEDLPFVDAERGVYGVIDGVGGQAAGEFAAAIAHDVILQRLARPLGTPSERVREAIAIANNEIFRRAGTSHDLSGMTCVVTLAIVNDGRLTIGHVGDSRLYKLRAEGMQKLTHDHSPVGEREDAQEITEVDAMRHPRRHEVFRDVGGALRDKDEEDYVEVIEQPLERDSAILLCTDGLTDMVPSATIDRLVRQHAGDPEAVVDSLVWAANEAGGRDNVTVVYAEGADFARAVRARPRNAVPAAPPGAAEELAATEPDGPQGPTGNPLLRFFRWIVRSRTTWFALGALTGVLSALWLVWRASDSQTADMRTIAVGPSASITLSSLSTAASTARPGDVLRLEPGVYSERVTLAEGVSLVARVPGSVSFVRPPISGPLSSDAWVAITAGGETGGRVSGVRIESTLELPIDVGIRVTGQSRAFDLVELTGPMRAGVELTPGASATLNGSHFSVGAAALVLAERAQLSAAGNIFLRTARPVVTPVKVGDAAQATLRHNVFVGYGSDIVKGASATDRKQILDANVIVTAEPSLIR